MDCPPPPLGNSRIYTKHYLSFDGLFYVYFIDPNIQNIIDKLAEFVARNGPEFEVITKQKQRNNPKFNFLYGGEYGDYYRYRVAIEQMRFCKRSNVYIYIYSFIMDLSLIWNLLYHLFYINI